MKGNLFTYKNDLVLVFILLNILILIKLNFFVPLLLGQTPMLDFDNYYRLTKDLLQGMNPYSVNYMITWGPPLIFIYYLPFQLFNLENARTLTTLFSLISGILTCSLLAKNLFSKDRLMSFLILTVILLSSFPARFSLEMGQPNLIIMFIVTCITLSKNNNFMALIFRLAPVFTS